MKIILFFLLCLGDILLYNLFNIGETKRCFIGWILNFIKLIIFKLVDLKMKKVPLTFSQVELFYLYETHLGVMQIVILINSLYCAYFLRLIPI